MHKEPRSKRVISERDVGTLGAAGHRDATHLFSNIAAHHARADGVGEAEPVLGADVEHVVAHQEPDNIDRVHEDNDHADEVEEEECPGEVHVARAQSPIDAPDIATDL